MNYQPQFKTLREILDEATCRHIVAVLKGAHSIKEACVTLGISDEHLAKLRKRYGLRVAPARNRKQMKLEEAA